ncbi:MAG: twin-arginine translocation signal domain-containing protein, partial [Planctomycetota bacterium]
MTNDSQADPPDLSRRSFLKGAGGAAAAGSLLASELRAAREQEADAAARIREGSFEIKLNINGEAQTVEVEPRTTLLSALRDR